MNQRRGFTQHHFFGHIRAVLGVHRKNKAGAGFTMIELLVYLALTGMVVLTATSFLVKMLGTKAIAASATNLQENARTVMETVTVSLRNAYEVTPSGTGLIIASHPSDSPSTKVYTRYDRVGDRVVVGTASSIDGITTQPLTNQDITAQVFQLTPISNAVDVMIVLKQGNQSTLLQSTIAYRQRP